ncbi:MAG: hypothetical protein WA956_07750 [Stenotrophomonas sp.]
MNTNKTCLLAIVVVLAGSAAPAHAARKPKAISLREAMAFEHSLQARASTPLVQPEVLYVQPVNKREPCQLPTSRDQLDRPNFRAYWDGECKNGFAFGLGRDIAISDTHHMEEITVHDGAGGIGLRPHVGYDHVAKHVSYAMLGSQPPAGVWLQETMDNAPAGLQQYQELTVTDESGRAQIAVTYSFNPVRFYVSTEGNVAWKFTDYSAVPVMGPTAPRFTMEVLDSQTKVPGGVAVGYLANGEERHVRYVNGVTQPVRLPADYVNHLRAKYQEVLNATSRASADLQRAQQIEREYLFKACNGKSGINGLDTATYTKICTWRDQFKEAYATASAQYQRQLEDMRQQATNAEQQRLIQNQIAMQQQMLQQQQDQQRWNELNQSSQQLQQRTQQIMQGVNSWQAPQVQPIAPVGGNRVTCTTVGRITTCR